MSEKMSQEKYMERINIIYDAPNIEIKEWNGYCSKIKYYCYKCGKVHENSNARNLLITKSYCSEKNNKRWTEDNFKARLKRIYKKDIQIISYSGLSKPLKYICPFCGQEKTLHTARLIFSKFSLCNECEGKEKNIIKKKIDKIFENNKDFKLLVWRGATKKADVQCLKCYQISKRLPSNIIECPNCCPNCNNGATKTRLDKEECQRRLDETFGDKSYQLLKYTGQLKKDNLIKCNSCGFIFETHFASFINQSRGCPKCRRYKSKGEQLVASILIELGVRFEEQKRFPDCNHGLSSFDFCVYNKDNEIYLIEVNGIQHYKQTTKFGDLEVIEKRDKLKEQYCIEHDIPLIVIPYWKLDFKNEIRQSLSFLSGSTTIPDGSREESVSPLQIGNSL